MAAQDNEAVWRAGPLSVCSSCHAPGGPSGIDLSTYERWQSLRMDIYQRVVVNRTIPPAASFRPKT